MGGLTLTEKEADLLRMVYMNVIPSGVDLEEWHMTKLEFEEALSHLVYLGILWEEWTEDGTAIMTSKAGKKLLRYWEKIGKPLTRQQIEDADYFMALYKSPY